jgi:hypothetical protein
MGYSTSAGSSSNQAPGGQYSDSGGGSGTYIDAALAAAASAATSAAAAAISASTASVTTGTINGATIGATNPSSGKFTTLETTQTVGIGTTPVNNVPLLIGENITGNATSYGARVTSTIQSDVITTANIFNSAPSTAVASFTLGNLRHYHAQNLTLGSGSTVTTQTGFLAADLLSGVSNYGFRSLMTAGTNKWGLYMEGNADNYLAGNLGVGVTPLATVKNYSGFSGNSTDAAEYSLYAYMLAGARAGSSSKFAGTFVGQAHTGLNITGGVVGVQGNGNISGVGASMGQLIGSLGAISTSAAGTVLGTTASFQSTIQNAGASTFSGALIGYHAVDHAVTATGAVAAFYGAYTAAANKYNLCMAGTATNLFNGDLQAASAANILVTGTGGLGYSTGSGGSVTQTGSRTTNITSGIDKTNGSITLVSAAGSTSWQSFTVTNNKVAATDTVRVCQKSGTDLYMIHVTAVSAGSFRITFATTGGTTVEQPVFNFAVIKGVTS